MQSCWMVFHPVNYGRVENDGLCVQQDELQTNHELVATYRHHITATMNQSNVSQFLRSYNSRGALEMERPALGAGHAHVKTLTWVKPTSPLKKNYTFCKRPCKILTVPSFLLRFAAGARRFWLWEIILQLWKLWWNATLNSTPQRPHFSR